MFCTKFRRFMKKILLICLLTGLFSFAQDVYQYKSGGRIFENERKLHRDDIENYFGHRKDIMKEYNAGKTKKTVGNILFYSGTTIFLCKFFSESLFPKKPTFVQTFYGPQSVSDLPKNNTLLYVGGAMAIIAIPIKIGYSKRIKNAVHLMNQELLNQKKEQSYNIEYNIIGNSNGVGIKMTF